MISKEAMEWMWLLLICIIILLITACVMLEHRSQRDRELADKACVHLQNVMYALQQAEIKTGVCCCGDSMEGHDPGYNCGHSALDMFDYYGLPILDAAQKFLEDVRSDE